MVVVALVFLVTMPGQNRARAEVTAAGWARSASEMKEIAANCPDADKTKAKAYENAFVDIGKKQFGRQSIANVLPAEFLRRHKEVAATGRDAWCGYQKGHLFSMGINDVFLSPVRR
jgi:hypothetical protein